MEVVVCEAGVVRCRHRGWAILIAGKLLVLSVLAGPGWLSVEPEERLGELSIT